MKELKQIQLKQIQLCQNDKEINDVLIGKTIKNISFFLDKNEEESGLIIIFTDDTYIYLHCEEEYISSENDNKCWQIDNSYATPLESYHISPGYVSADGKLVFTKQVLEELRMGLIDVDEEYEKQRIIAEEERLKQSRYRWYLELKEEFEGKK